MSVVAASRLNTRMLLAEINIVRQFSRIYLIIYIYTISTNSSRDGGGCWLRKDSRHSHACAPWGDWRLQPRGPNRHSPQVWQALATDPDPSWRLTTTITHYLSAAPGSTSRRLDEACARNALRLEFMLSGLPAGLDSFGVQYWKAVGVGLSR